MAVREDRDAVAFAKGLRHADRDLAERRIERDAGTGPAREAKADRPAIRRSMPVRGPHHLAKLGFVLRCHERHPGQDP